MLDAQKCTTQSNVCPCLLLYHILKLLQFDGLNLFYILEFLRHLKNSLCQPSIYEREHKAGYVGEGS